MRHRAGFLLGLIVAIAVAAFLVPRGAPPARPEPPAPAVAGPGAAPPRADRPAPAQRIAAPAPVPPDARETAVAVTPTARPRAVAPPSPTQGARLVVTVTDRSGRPVEGADVFTGSGRGQRTVIDQRPEAVTDVRGVAAFRAVRARPGQRIAVVARKGADEGVAGPAPVEDDETHFEVVLRPPDEPAPGRGSVRLTIRLAGEPARDRPVAVAMRVGNGTTYSRVRTDAEGRCYLRDAEPGPVDLTAAVAGFAPGRARIEVVEGRLVDHEVDLAEGAVVGGRVILPAGKHASQVSVVATSPSRREGVAEDPAAVMSDADATYRIGGLEPGRYTIRGTLAGFAPASGQVTIAGPGHVAGPDLQFSAGITVSGRLKTGPPAGRRSVRLSSSTAPSAGFMQAGDAGREDVATDAEGRFEVKGVQPGKYTLRVVLGSSLPREEISLPVEVPPGSGDVDLGEIVVAPRFGNLDVQVVGRDGAPATEGTLILIGPGHRSRGPIGRDGRSGGRVVEAGDFIVMASTRDAASPALAVHIEPGETKAVTLALEDAGFIAGRIIAPPGFLRFERVHLDLAPVVEGAPPPAQPGSRPIGGMEGVTIEVNADGTFRTEGLAPGRYRVGPGFGEFAAIPGVPVRREVVVAAGVEEQVSFPALALSIRVSGLTEGERASLRASWTGADGATPEADRRTSRGVAEGPTRIAYAVPGPGTLHLQIEIEKRSAAGPGLKRTLPPRDLPVPTQPTEVVEVTFDATAEVE